MEDSAQRFLDLFTGSQGAHGQTDVLGRQKNGKQQAKYNIVREPLTVELVQEHLDGSLGVGSIPIDETNKCQFGALDIDDYSLDLPVLLAKVKRFKLPLVMCRSKSGGAHLFLFMSERVAASEMRDRLAEFASALGWGNCEIFPKQEELLAERGDVGNFINLPYQNAKYTTRYALKKNGDSMSLAEFLTAAEKARVTAKQLANISLGGDNGVLPDGPPCLQQLTEFGTPEGGRNMTLLNVGVCTTNRPRQTIGRSFWRSITRITAILLCRRGKWSLCRNSWRRKSISTPVSLSRCTGIATSHCAGRVSSG